MQKSICLIAFIAGLFAAAPVVSQVHYHKDGRPWSVTTKRGPDAIAGGWYYNLGITGMRAVLVEKEPTQLLVKYVFHGTPAHGKVKPGDVLIGANGRKFVTPHRNGYSVEVFGGKGPLRDIGIAIEESQGRKLRGKLSLAVLRYGKTRKETIDLGTANGAYGKKFPSDCPKSDRIRKQLCDFIAGKQRSDGSWGHPHINTFSPLALLASGESRYLPLVKKNAEFHARKTRAKDRSSLINWRYMAAGIVMGEYYLRTKEKWVLPELKEVYQFLLSSQYTDLSQVAESAKKRKLPRREGQALGGWGHNPGFEGYGPIAMVTGQGALTLAVLKHCGIDVDRARLDSAYDFLARGTGRNGYLWYADSPSRHDRWADMGRTGASAVANFLSPYKDRKYRASALAHARAIGDHPETLPDTHGSPMMGMGYTALGAHVDRASFRRMMDSNRWWFTLAQCPDGTFYYQPNRDNNPYDFTNGAGRLSASAVVALIFSMDEKNLLLTGGPKRK